MKNNKLRQTALTLSARTFWAVVQCPEVVDAADEWSGTKQCKQCPTIKNTPKHSKKLLTADVPKTSLQASTSLAGH
jgi:hypothetical protein